MKEVYEKDSLPDPLELAVLAFLFITAWGMTVGIALTSPMLSLTSWGLRMQEPILQQVKGTNINHVRRIKTDKAIKTIKSPCKVKTTVIDTWPNTKINSNTTTQPPNKKPHQSKEINTPPPPYLDKPTVPKSGACSICAPIKLPCFQSGMPAPLVNTK